MEQKIPSEFAQIILKTQEEERLRIAQILHSELGQLLFGVKLSLAKLRYTQDHHSEETLKALRQSEKLLDDAIRESRRLSHELMPLAMEEYGLKKALEQICRQFEETVNIDCNVTGLKPNLKKYLTLAVYRFVQELVLNLIKHACANYAKIILIQTNQAVYLTVEDNGCGFIYNPNLSLGIGLATIRNSVEVLNGSFLLSSKPDKGTRVEIILPIMEK